MVSFLVNDMQYDIFIPVLEDVDSKKSVLVLFVMVNASSNLVRLSSVMFFSRSAVIHADVRCFEGVVLAIYTFTF